MVDPNSVGQGRTYESAEQAHDAENGTYSDPADTQDLEGRLPTSVIPKAPDPDPFTLGGAGGAGGGKVLGG